MKDENLVIYNEQDIESRFSMGLPYRPEQTSIFLIEKGQVELNYNFSNHVVSSHSVLILRPGNVYEFLCFSTDIKFVVVAFNRHFQSNAAINIRQCISGWFYTSHQKNHYEYTENDFAELWTTAQLLQNRIRNKISSKINEDIVRYQFLSVIYLIVDILQKYIQIESSEINRSEQLAHDFTQLVSIHYLLERSIAFYANRLNLTANHLSDTVKAIPKHTPREIINLALLTEAKIQLSKPEKTIKQIADDLKFSDQYVFSKFFKRLTMITPTVFRDKL